MEASVLEARGAHIAYPGKFLRWLLQGCVQKKLKVHPTSCLDTSSATMLSCKEASLLFCKLSKLERMVTKLKLMQGQAVPEAERGWALSRKRFVWHFPLARSSTVP